MKLYEILTLVAIVLGPIIAIQLEKFLEKQREIKGRKLAIFKTLMATRGSKLSTAHVEALNRIDLEFSNNRKYKKVIDSWKEYFDNLCQRADSTEQLTSWVNKNEELLTNMLYEMGKTLDYNFDKVLIKRNAYLPVGHERAEQEEQTLREGLIKIIKGEETLPISVYQEVNEEALEKQMKLQDLMIKHYSDTAKQD